MIGQKRLLQEIDNLIDDFPALTILIGQEGSGKKKVCEYIKDKLNILVCTAEDNKIETVRQIIKQSYQTKVATLFVFYDVDDMSLPSRHALLKVSEEPPNNAHFLMTCKNESSILDTIKSRAYILRMGDYTTSELLEYANTAYKFTDDEISIIKNLSVVPGDIDKLQSIDMIAFYDYVHKVIDNIAEVSGAHSFKLADKLSLKEDAKGYDLQLFFRAFILICLNNIKAENDNSRWGSGIKITSRYLQDLQISGISKKMLVDSWILDIRKEWS